MEKVTFKKICIGILMVVIPCALSVAFGFLYKRQIYELLRNTIMLTIGTICLVFSWLHFDRRNQLEYNNAYHMLRFALFFIGSCLFACLLPVFPFSVWPVMAAAVALALFSNAFLGLFAYSSIMMFAVFLAEASSSVFFLYFISGAVAILLMNHLDENFKVGIPIAISLLFFLVAETATVVLFVNERLSFKLFILPVLNLFFSGLLLLCTLKYFSFAVVHKYRNRYMEVVDPEFEIMAEMKKEAEDDYFQALHTAFFAERIATAIHANVVLAKAGAYYHRLGKIYRETKGNTLSEEEIVKQVCEEYEFPPDILPVILECIQKKYRSRESTVVMFADSIVTSVLFLLEKNPNAAPDYNQMVEVIFKRKQESGILNDSSITARDIVIMKEIFIREKLYYDFLRRK